MRTRLKVEDPGKIVFTLVATATADEWEQFRTVLDEIVMKSLQPKGEVYAFRNAIDDLLSQARRIYWHTTPTNGEET